MKQKFFPIASSIKDSLKPPAEESKSPDSSEKLADKLLKATVKKDKDVQHEGKEIIHKLEGLFKKKISQQTPTFGTA